jgi:hypothetical protein
LFGGGVADKFGNIYEARWAARVLLQVLRGEARSIRLEGLSKAFQGFEFAVQYDDRVEWHQTKINAPQGNWTINALDREGVLSAISQRVAVSGTDRCVFVSQSPINPIRALAEKAHYANGFDDFEAAIGKEATEHFGTLRTKLGLGGEATYDWLRRTQFRVIPEAEITDLIETYADLLFSSPAETAFADVRAFLEARMNREITTELVGAELGNTTNIKIKEWSLAPSLRARIKAETDAYLASYTPFGAGGQAIPRAEVKTVVGHLLAPDGPHVILLSGVAGVGKSGVVRGILAELEGAGVLNLAFRIDHLLDAKTPRDFGSAILDRSESPATSLKGVEADRVSVLVVDQIDAVSEVSGRNGAAKNAVLRLVSEARAYGTVRVLLVCRTFDIESDERIKALRAQHGVVTVEVKRLEWADDVAPLLANLNIETVQFSESQRQLLCVPVNLAVYIAVANETGTAFASRKDLFDRLLVQKERAIGLRSVPWAAEAPLSALAEWMSERQRLDAPETVIASYGRALDLLQSEQLIVRNKGGVGFFHESFFDYVFARRFAATDGSIMDLLLGAEQHLFRRTQVRQLLEHLRQADAARYLDELRMLLFDARIRVHIKTAVAQWLGTVAEPTADELDLVLELDRPGEIIPMLPRMILFGSVGWFDRLHEIGWDAKGLLTEARRQQTLWWLAQHVGARGKIIARLLDSWWGGDPDRAEKLVDWFGYIHSHSAGGAVIDLCERVILSKPAGLFPKDGTLRRDVLLYDITAEGNRLASAQTLKALLDVWYDQHPGRHPFESSRLSQLDLYSLGEFAKSAPREFAQASVDALMRALRMMADPERERNDYTFRMRVHGGRSYGSDQFLHLFRTSLGNVARDDTAAVRSILAKIDPHVHEAATHLYLETIAASGEALADLLHPLLNSPHLLNAGWGGARWRSFADAAREAMPHLSDVQRAAVEKVILDHRPEMDFAVELARDLSKGEPKEGYRSRRTAMHYLNENGFEQFSMLETIGPAALTPTTRRLLEELRRKFWRQPPRQPNSYEVYRIDSPMTAEQAGLMTDANWLSAMAKYAGEREPFSRKRTGGARELSSTLQQRAKAEPDRFARLGLALPEDVNANYLKGILSGLAESDAIDLPLTRRLIARTHAILGHPHGQEIARLFERHPLLAQDTASLTILFWYAQYGEASDQEDVEAKHVERETLTVDNLLEKGGKLYIRGINGARGYAVEALASVLWHVPSAIEPGWSFIEERVAQERLISVRCCILHALAPLFNSDKKRASLLLEALVQNPDAQGQVLIDRLGARLAFAPQRLPSAMRIWLASCTASLFDRRTEQDGSKWVAPLMTHQGTHLLPYIIYQIPDVGRRLILRLLSSGDPTARLLGVWHVLQASFHDAGFIALAEAYERRSTDARRLASSVSADAAVEDDFRVRATEKLGRYFDDTDEDVRKLAAEVFRSVPKGEFSSFIELARRFVVSAAYMGHSFSFLHALEEAESNVTDLIATAAEHALEELQRQSRKLNGHDMEIHQLKDLIRDEYAASERDARVRKRLLDIIDTMAALELYGVDDIIKAHDR